MAGMPLITRKRNLYVARMSKRRKEMSTSEREKVSTVAESSEEEGQILDEDEDDVPRDNSSVKNYK